MKDDRFFAKNQRQAPGVKVIFSEKAFLAVIYATVIGFGYLYPQARSAPQKTIEQVRSSQNK
jgi:hypothetical protein